MAPMRSGVFIGAVFLGIRQQAEGGCVDDWDQKWRFDSNRFFRSKDFGFYLLAITRFMTIRSNDDTDDRLWSRPRYTFHHEAHA